MFFKIFKSKQTTKNTQLDENVWNNKWPKAPIIYNGRALRGSRKTERIAVDVKKFISTNDEILKNVVSRYRLKKSNEDETALAVQKFVVNFLTYEYDEKTSDVVEFWMFPFETIQSKYGDCEDGAILITSLMIEAGIPAWRCKVGAGNVQAAPTAPMGGHAYSLYLASDGSWRILDWCYYEDSSTRILQKPLAKDGGQKNAYKDVWFTFNNEYSWAQTSLSINRAHISNHQTAAKKVVLSEGKVAALEEVMKKIDKIYKS